MCQESYCVDMHPDESETKNFLFYLFMGLGYF